MTQIIHLMSNFLVFGKMVCCGIFNYIFFIDHQFLLCCVPLNPDYILTKVFPTGEKLFIYKLGLYLKYIQTKHMDIYKRGLGVKCGPNSGAAE